MIKKEGGVIRSPVVTKKFAVVLLLLLIVDIVIFLNIIVLRQILGFLFLTLLPGLLILRILKLNEICLLEKFILAWGLSISFLMFFGLLLNNLSLTLGYETPLSTVSLLISFNIAFIVLAIIDYKINKTQIFSFSNLNLTTSKKAFLIVPILFPALCIFGMHILNTTDNNIILMFLLILIPTYVAFVCFFNHKFPKGIYPIVIFSISISLLLLMALRSNHLIGYDTHEEYYLFMTTLGDLHWSLSGHSGLDACLSISILPTIYQSILNISPEFLFKILYSSLFSVSPLVIYVLSKKYVEDGYAFLASCFFMSQHIFLSLESHSRTSIAILFFALAMMTLFNDNIDPLKKRILFLVFMASCVVSHYSTTYVFFFIMLGAFIGMEVLSKKYTIKKSMSFTTVILFFALIFFWYSQVTEEAFNSGVNFVEITLTNLNRFFIEESRRACTSTMFGAGVTQMGIPEKIHLLSTWITFAFIGIGVVTLIMRYKEMSFHELKFKKPDFLKDKFGVEYFLIALISVGLLIAVIAVPYVSIGYDLHRAYTIALTVLSVFFVLGGIIISKHFFFFTKHFLSKERTCTKKECNSFGKSFLFKKRFVLKEKQKSLTKNLSLKKIKREKEGRKGEIGKGEKNGSEVLAYLIILLVLIPYFFCITGVMHNIFGAPRKMILNSEGVEYDMFYIHDQESYAAQWLNRHAEKRNLKIGADPLGVVILKSQGSIHAKYISIITSTNFKTHIYLRYDNVINKRLFPDIGYHNITEYSILFVEKNKIYDTRGSEIWH